MLPRRFKVIRPYLASLFYKECHRPPISEVMRWLTQPDKKRRASRYIQSCIEHQDFIEVHFVGFDNPFFYPRQASWIDLCQTIDEVFNPNNWHHFISKDTPISSTDVVIDCGAAEGLFSYYAARMASKVFAIEPIPMWHKGMEKTFGRLSNVEIIKAGVGHKNAIMRMTDEEICSHVSSRGSLEIPIRTLDSLFADNKIPVTFLKADIEGFEFQMLLGAENLIRQNRPKISMTMYHDTNHFVQAREFLLDLHSDYRFRLRGIAANGHPILMQAF